MRTKVVHFLIALAISAAVGLILYFILPRGFIAEVYDLQPIPAMDFLVPVFAALGSMFLIYEAFLGNTATEFTLQEFKKEERVAVEELKQSDPDFATLWFITQGRIDYYHKIATDQARRSFISSQIATGAGFALVIIVAIIAARTTNPIAAISAGAVGIVGGGLSAYIGATFMKSQSEASAQLRQFFLQPVELSRVLGAERLLEKLPRDQKSEAVQQIIKSMMAPGSYGDEKKEP
jgi:hypothetical protein